MKSKTNITRKQVKRLLCKMVVNVRSSDLGEHELYILVRALYSELLNMDSKLTLLDVLRLNADCIVD